MNFYVNRHSSFSLFNRGFNNAGVIHTLLFNSIVQIVASGFSFAHISSHTGHTIYFFSSCIYSISLQQLHIKPLSTAFDPLQSSLHIIFPSQERCTAFPQVFFPDLISSLCHHLTSIHSFATSLLCSLHICLTFLSPLTLYLSASCSS